MAEQPPDFLPIDFLIIGGSICGLSSAIALRRAGHNVTVFDLCSPLEPNPIDSGCRLSPNSTKIYYRWGLEQQLRDVSVKVTGSLFAAYDSGGVYGNHQWADDVVSQTGGDFLCIHFFELRKILAETAIELGATIRAPMKVVGVHPDRERPWVTLENGEVVHGDVLVGCDGSAWKGWVTRTAVLDALGEDETCDPWGMQIYAMVLPDAALDNIRDEDIRSQLRTDLFTWLGVEYSAVGFPIKKPTTEESEFVLLVYGPRYEECRAEDLWEADSEEIQRMLDNADPLLKELVTSAPKVICVPMVRRNHCPEWVHPDGRLLVLGEAAHPLVLGTVYSLGMSAGDAATLGRIFSHLTRKGQIDSFLSAVQEVRKGRVDDLMRRAAGNIFGILIPPAIAAAHDREMSRQVEEGLRSLRGKRRVQPQSSEQLVATVEDIFAIEPEDEADDWWVRWGALGSHVARRNRADGEVGSEERAEGEELRGHRASFSVCQQVTVVTEVHSL
ncbi:hypothetical protein V8D89_016204 [Ganoderma adspersum]